MKKLNYFILLVIAIMVSSSVYAQKELRYNLKVGEKYGLKQTTVQDIEQNVSGMVQEVKNTLGGDISLTINDKTDGVYTSEIVFETMLFKMESAMMNMVYDSEDETVDQTNPLNKTFSLIVGHPFQMRFDERGNILEVKGFDTIGDKVVAAFSDNPQQGEMMKKALSSQFSNDNMKNNLGSMFITYPEEKIKAGTKWTNNKQLTQPVMINNTFNYNVESIGKEVVTLSGAGTMDTVEGQVKEEMGMTQHFNLNGNLVISAIIDAKTGWPREVKLTQNLDGNVAIESPQLPTPMEMPMKIKVESTYTTL